MVARSGSTHADHVDFECTAEPGARPPEAASQSSVNLDECAGLQAPDR